MKKLKIVVVGTLACDPYAGMAWMHMQIVVGLQRIGHDVYYFDTTSTWPYNPILQSRVDNVDYAVPYLRNIAEQFGLSGRWAYYTGFCKKSEWFGMNKLRAEDLLANADLVLNVSGATAFEVCGLKVGRLIFYGTDPVYYEIKYAQGDASAISIIDEHDDTVTYGENIGNPDCPLPPLPRLKAKTRQPILTDLWKNELRGRDEFTTIGNWKQLGKELTFKGEVYHWSKHYEVLKFIDLPKLTKQTIELATNLAKDDEVHHTDESEIPAGGVALDEYSMLRSYGWKLVDGPALTADPWSYKEYILNSRGEFTFAKDQNIRLRSGWFSERSACYLAAGKPVVAQDTAFGCALPTGTGLFAFNTMDDILSAFESINGNYQKHCNAAREIAEEYFKAEKVLAKLINDLYA